MMLNQLQKLFSVERDGRIIKYGEEERSEEKVVVAYFKLLTRRVMNKLKCSVFHTALDGCELSAGCLYSRQEAGWA